MTRNATHNATQHRFGTKPAGICSGQGNPRGRVPACVEVASGGCSIIRNSGRAPPDSVVHFIVISVANP